MRWSSSERLHGRPWRRVPATLLSTGAVITAVACVSSTTHFYAPVAGQPRLSVDELRDRSDAFLRVECPRLLDSRASATGVARLSVTVSPSGDISRSAVSASSGDERMDAIFGALAAQLTVQPPPDGRTEEGRLRLGYSCSPAAVATTVELNK